MAKQCSFCEARATTMIVDDSDFFDCCAKCKVAWNGNPGFIRADTPLTEQIARDVATIDALPADQQAALSAELSGIHRNPGIIFAPAIMTKPGGALTDLELLADAVSALRYIEQRYGRLEGVGWDRVFDAFDARLAIPTPRNAG